MVVEPAYELFGKREHGAGQPLQGDDLSPATAIALKQLWLLHGMGAATAEKGQRAFACFNTGHVRLEQNTAAPCILCQTQKDGLGRCCGGEHKLRAFVVVGQVRAGWHGMIAAGVCFIMPAALIVLACARAYVQFGTLPAAEWSCWASTGSAASRSRR